MNVPNQLFCLLATFVLFVIGIMGILGMFPKMEMSDRWSDPVTVFRLCFIAVCIMCFLVVCIFVI